MDRHIHIEERGDVALVRIDRPPANALDLDLLEEGHTVREELVKAAPGAVVLAGRDGFFSAGMDLKVAPTLTAGQQRATVQGINRLFAGWYEFPRPVVAAVTGHAIAGGLILALCADHRVCSTEGKLGLTELRAGLPYPVAAIGVVRAELAPPVARRLVLRAELVEPPAALELGLVDELCAPGEVVSRALEVASELAALPRTAYTKVKQQLRAPAMEAIDRALAGGAGDPLLAGWVGAETQGAAAAMLGGDR